jgi:hypothetical protein
MRVLRLIPLPPETSAFLLSVTSTLRISIFS